MISQDFWQSDFSKFILGLCNTTFRVFCSMLWLNKSRVRRGFESMSVNHNTKTQSSIRGFEPMTWLFFNLIEPMAWLFFNLIFVCRILNVDRGRSVRTATRRRRRYGDATAPASPSATRADSTTSYTGYVARQILNLNYKLSCNTKRQPRYLFHACRQD